MSASQNLAYAIVQVVHNFGAVAAVGASLAALKFRSVDTRRNFAKLALAGWGTQAASGAAFGAVELLLLPPVPGHRGNRGCGTRHKNDLRGDRFFLLLATYLFRSINWAESKMNAVWITSSAFAVTALSAAAFLRWFP